MAPTDLPLFPGLVSELLGERSAANQLARDDALTSELVTYCRMARAPAVLPDTIEAGDAWGANCGPMALAAVLGLPTVQAARPLVEPFRGFMSPTDILAALTAAARVGLVERFQHMRSPADPWPEHGLARIQWVGPWCDLPDPRAAYRYTHWVAVRRGPVPAEDDVRLGYIADDAVLIYDATPNRWIPLARWEKWNPTLWPKRATGWAPVTRIDVSIPTGPKGET